ncbi:hypothetical protein KCP74_24345 [Salmonella enterica subsp. enterica]|nr:hypothetical protein KCP74_24345 [Salmonella enterica subsp. enterica]
MQRILTCRLSAPVLLLALFTPENWCVWKVMTINHLSHPLLKAIEFWITPALFCGITGHQLLRHPVQIAIGKPEEAGDAEVGK